MSVFQSIYKRLPAPIRRAVGSLQAKDSSGSAPLRPIRIQRIEPGVEASNRKIDELERMASEIPSMGGTEIGLHLRKAARQAPAGTSIVEVGSWLGAGTAQLALGLREREMAGSVDIYCYDRWEANEPEVAKALRMKNVNFKTGDDTLPWVMNALRPFAVPISFVKVDFRDAGWSGGPISVYVDDAAKTPQKFFHVLKTFGPHWMPGVTVVVLMDYHYWERTGDDKHKCQKRFVENYRDHFSTIENFRFASSDAFLYRKKLNFDSLSPRSLQTDAP